MKVAIDVSSLVYGTGVSVYAEEIVRAIAKLGTGHEYVLFSGTLRQGQWYRDWFDKMKFGDNFQMKVLPLSPKMQTVLWNDWSLGKLEWLIGDFDVYHSLDWSLAPTKKPTVITVHDLFFLKKPDVQKHPFEKSLEERLVKAKKRGVKAIAVSNTTKNDLTNLIGYDDNLIEVVYEACPSGWKSISDNGKWDDIKRKYSLPEKFLLAVSTQEPRKNLHRLIEAHGKMNGQVPLVLVGKKGWGTEIGNKGNIITTGYVATEELIAIWSKSAGFVYPSIYEGFGLPILQSFISEVPVLTSKAGSMIEVGGNAVIYVDPESVDSICIGLEKLVALDEKQKMEMIKSGLVQVKKFSWEKAAKETVSIYESFA